MNIIYVVVKKSGQYDDYNMENMFASLSRQKAEQKLSELEAANQDIFKASEELRAFHKEYEIKFPIPHYKIEWQSFGYYELQKMPEYQAWQNEVSAYFDAENEIENKKAEELSLKYNVPVDSIQLYDDHIIFSIQEIESD